MMDRSYPSIEFEAEVNPDGEIKIPATIARKLKGIKRVTLRLTEGVVSGRLQRRKVTEEEIEQIAALQLEQREHVIRFLESEGALTGNKLFGRRARSSMGPRT